VDVIEVPADQRRIPFLDVLMPVFDEDGDGLLSMVEMNRSLVRMGYSAQHELQRLSSLGLYNFNSSTSPSTSHFVSFAGGSYEMDSTLELQSIDVDGDSCVLTLSCLPLPCPSTTQPKRSNNVCVATQGSGSLIPITVFY